LDKIGSKIELIGRKYMRSQKLPHREVLPSDDEEEENET
jgi:hypothetical protein